MKKNISFSQILHKDKLMMVVSLILAIIIWVLVVYDQGNTEERSIGGIPVSVTLTPFASEDLKLRIVDGAEAVATVYVEGPRSVIAQLSKQDITVTADTSTVLTAGTYTIPIRAASNGDYDIVKVVGSDGVSATVRITCDVIYEKSFVLTADNVEMPHLSVVDSQTTRFGAPSPSGAAIKEGSVIVSGPKSSVNRISRIAAIVQEERRISETTSFTADLVAYDSYDRPVEGITFLNAEDGQINVVVPVLQYYPIPLTLNVLNAPEGLVEKVTVNPQSIELWAIPSELDEYLVEVNNLLTVDFRQVLAEGKDIALPLELKKTGSVLPFSNSETVQVDLDVSAYRNKTFVVPLTEENVEVLNLAEGCKLEWDQNELQDVVICGSNSILRNIKANQIKVVVDAQDLTVGHYTVKVAVQFGEAETWTYYGEGGYEVQINIVEE